MTIDQYPDNQIAAAIVACTLAGIGVAGFLAALRLTTHWPDTELNRIAAIAAAVLAAMMFIFAGGALLFLAPVIAGFLIAVGLITFTYGYAIENRPWPAQLAAGAAATTAGIRRQHLMSPAEFHERHQDGDPRGE